MNGGGKEDQKKKFINVCVMHKAKKTNHGEIEQATIIHYMNRVLISLFISLLSITLSAQTSTYYYRLSKEKIGGKENNEVTGGQFITITKHKG